MNLEKTVEKQGGPQAARPAALALLRGGMLLAAVLALPVGAQPLPAVNTAATANYISGGVGDEELEALAGVVRQYSLKLVFAEGGSFLSDVAVLIEDARGQPVIEAVSDGPWFLARLKPGRYRLKAAALGVEKSRPFSIQPGRQTQLVVRWP